MQWQSVAQPRPYSLSELTNVIIEISEIDVLGSYFYHHDRFNQ